MLSTTIPQEGVCGVLDEMCYVLFQVSVSQSLGHDILARFWDGHVCSWHCCFPSEIRRDIQFIRVLLRSLRERDCPQAEVRRISNIDKI